MTGEVTLRGKVLPIGGLKAKSIAAHRAGIKTAIFPKQNAKDIPDLPDKVKKDLCLIPVAHVDEVIKHALLAPIGKPFGQYLLTDDDLKIPPPERATKGSERGVRA